MQCSLFLIFFKDQRPWILNETLKENVLFGSEYNEDLFELAISSAAMQDDIAMLPSGIMTEIGEKGINLSGGQKARVSLARAIYRDADIYLLDDPLSAVDAHVSEHIFNRCILGALREKTRILVTHQVHLLSRCDKVIVLEDGKLKGFGTHSEMKDLIGASLVTNSNPDCTLSCFSAAENGDVGPTISIVKSLSSAIEINQKSCTVIEDKSDSVVTGKKLMTKEEKHEGDVLLMTYMYYLQSGGLYLFSVVFVTMTISSFFNVYSTFWLADWGTAAVGSHEGLSVEENMYYLDFYAIYLMIGVGFLAFRGLVFAQHRLRASKKLHHDMLIRILGAPISFFDTTPLGRILNRFSSDMGVVDEDLSQSFNQVLNSFFQVIGCLGAICGSTKGTFLLLLIPIAVIYIRVQKYFRKTNTVIARLESISRSPIYADFSQVLAGLNTLRAYQCQERFVLKLEHLVNRNSSAAVLTNLASQWLSIRLDILGAFITLFVCLLAASSPNFIPPAYIGIGLSFSFQLTTYIKFGVRMSAQNEAQMNAVERIKFYADNIVQEEPDIKPRESTTGSNSCCGKALSVEYKNVKNTDIVIPPENWPEFGNIDADDIHMGYRDGPLVLKGVSFSIKGKEKVGVAGRTGSGKSSMINVLFRIETLREGKICIDGINIASIPLQVLRSRLGIIPQDPVMFSASVRFNLDPLGLHSDEELWQVLKCVDMKEAISSFPSQLSEEVSEGGENLSVGQRQLICIARVLLRKPKLLVLDEATASIDNETDRVIQCMIRDQFVGSTVITIAHRLHTIIDSDKVMVLDQGRLVEMDSPEKLLLHDSAFKSLWDRHQSSQRSDIK